MTEVFLSLGSNIEPEHNIRMSVLSLCRKLDVKAVSTVYLTAPVRGKGQPHFYNCVLLAEYDGDLRKLKFGTLRVIEDSLGRKRTADRYSPRTIDIDILLSGQQTVSEDDLVIPDPDILKRRFLAAAVAELRPGLRIPGTHLDIDTLATTLPDEGMRPLPEFTRSLRELIG